MHSKTNNGKHINGRDEWDEEDHTTYKFAF